MSEPTHPRPILDQSLREDGWTVEWQPDPLGRWVYRAPVRVVLVASDGRVAIPSSTSSSVLEPAVSDRAALLFINAEAPR